MQRRKVFEYIVRDLMKHPEAMILPWWAIALHWFLFPLVSLNWFVQERNGYDVRSDSWTINGIRFSGSSFYHIGQPGKRFEVIEIDKTGTLTLRELE